MIRRIAVAVIIAGLLIPLSAAPAGAARDPSPAPAGCVGPGCTIQLSQFITLNGDHGTGAGFAPIAVDPPPCLWEPFGDAVTGSRHVATASNLLAALPPGSNPLGLANAVQEAKHLLRTHASALAGTWFELVGNPAASPSGVLACLKLPLFVFVPPGGTPPAPPIPPRTIAEFAYNHMLIPVPAITTNPADKGFVNLGTYVWGSWADSPNTGLMNAYKITATLAGGPTVTVWAQASKFSVNVAGPGTPYSGGCGPAGSRFPAGHPPAGAGPGAAPDCGVLWRAPTTGAALTATVRWTVTWGVGDLNGPGPNVLPPIVVTGPAPPFVVPVNEIQSVNGG